MKTVDLAAVPGCNGGKPEGSPVENGKPLAARDYALIDLHLHLDGSLSLASVRELAAMQQIALPESDRELLARLQVGRDCRDLNEYLEKFLFPLTLLQTRESITAAVWRLAEEVREQGLIYAEIRFAPQLHTKGGLSQSEVIEAAIAGAKKSDLHSNLILCCMRGKDNREQNLETAQLAKKYLGRGVCAIDLAGAEALFPTREFVDVFALAKEEHIPFTIHSGEASGPQSVYQALAFGAKRIGHGVRSLEDAQLVSTLVEEEVSLELCPTSNLNTRIFERMEDYPIRQFLEVGVRATVNTDNMTVSNVSLESEFQAIMDTFSLTKRELETLARNAAAASFADAEEKAWLFGELDRRFHG